MFQILIFLIPEKFFTCTPMHCTVAQAGVMLLPLLYTRNNLYAWAWVDWQWNLAFVTLSIEGGTLLTVDSKSPLSHIQNVCLTTQNRWWECNLSENISTWSHRKVLSPTRMVSPNILKILYIAKSDDETKFELNYQSFFFYSWNFQVGPQILTLQNGAQVLLFPDIKGNI